MSEEKWTPGPWKVDPPIGAEHAEIRDVDGRRIAVSIGGYPRRTKTEDANANLIAAAPEMYNALDCGALRELLGEIEDCGSERLWHMARLWMELRDEVLKKARSEE